MLGVVFFFLIDGFDEWDFDSDLVLFYVSCIWDICRLIWNDVFFGIGVVVVVCVDDNKVIDVL